MSRDRLALDDLFRRSRDRTRKASEAVSRNLGAIVQGMVDARMASIAREGRGSDGTSQMRRAAEATRERAKAALRSTPAVRVRGAVRDVWQRVNPGEPASLSAPPIDPVGNAAALGRLQRDLAGISPSRAA